MTYVHRHWQGDISIAKAVWLSGFCAELLTEPFDLYPVYDFLRYNPFDVDDLVSRAVMGDLSAYDLPFYLQLIGQIVSITVLVWWAVGVWRACENPANNPGKPKFHWSAKLTIFAAVLIWLYHLYNFIDEILDRGR